MINKCVVLQNKKKLALGLAGVIFLAGCMDEPVPSAERNAKGAAVCVAMDATSNWCDSGPVTRLNTGLPASAIDGSLSLSISADTNQILLGLSVADSLKVSNAIRNPAGAFNWRSNPLSLTTTGIALVPLYFNPKLGEGMAVYPSNNHTVVSETMTLMHGHFAGTTTFSNTSPVKILTNLVGTSFLLTLRQTNTTDVALEMRTRTGAAGDPTWSSTAVSLVRAGVSVIQTSIKAFFNVEGNIVVVWKETTTDNSLGVWVSVYSASATAPAWSNPTDLSNMLGTEVVPGDLVDLDLVAIPTTTDLSLILFQSNAVGQSVYNMAFTSEVWQAPVQLVAPINGAVVHAANNAGHAVLVWEAAATSGNNGQWLSLRYRAATGWDGVPTKIADVTAPYAAVGTPNVSINASGTASVVWYEDIETTMGKLYHSRQTALPNAAWENKELVASTGDGEFFHNPIVVIDPHANPWIVWTQELRGEPSDVGVRVRQRIPDNLNQAGGDGHVHGG